MRRLVSLLLISLIAATLLPTAIGASAVAHEDTPTTLGSVAHTAEPVGAYRLGIDRWHEGTNEGVLQPPLNAMPAELRPPCVPAPPNMVSWCTGDGNAQDIRGQNHGV